MSKLRHWSSSALVVYGETKPLGPGSLLLHLVGIMVSKTNLNREGLLAVALFEKDDKYFIAKYFVDMKSQKFFVLIFGI